MPKVTNKKVFIIVGVIFTLFTSLRYSFAKEALPQLFWAPEKIKEGILLGRQSHGVVNFKDSLVVLGGEKDGEYLTDVLSSKNGKEWKQEAKSVGWSGRSGSGAVVLKDNVFVLGGFGASGYKNDVWSSGDGKSWVSLDTKVEWSARSDMTAISFKDKLWIFGGVDALGYQNDIWSSADGKSWQKEGEGEWSPRANHKILLFKDKLFLLGGVGESGRLNDVWSSSDGVNWTKDVANAPWFGRYGFSTVVSKDKLYILTAGEKFNNQNNLWSSSDGKNWEQEIVFPGFPFMIGYNTVLLGGKIFLIGGQIFSGEYSKDVYSYLVDSTQSLLVPSVPIITSISPTSKSINSGAFTLTIDGSGFTPSSVVELGGTSRLPVTFISSDQLKVSVPASLISSAGFFIVEVIDSTRGGGGSNYKEFSIEDTIGPILPLVRDLPPVYSTTAADILAIDNSFDSALATISNLTISEFNNTTQSVSADLKNAEAISVGSIRLSFPADSLYSDSLCPFSFVTCGGLETTRPSLGFASLSSAELADTYLKTAIARLSLGLKLLSSHMFYIEVVSQFPVDDPESNINVSKAPMEIQLIIKEPTVANWKNAALYQYNSSSRNFVRIGGFVRPAENGTVTLNAKTIRQDVGYLFAVFGR